MTKHRMLFLDFETLYSDEYSLTKMPTPNYILDHRFECIMCAVKEDMQPAHLVDGPDFPKFIAQYDPAETTTVTFNALFDNSILAWRYGFVPARMLDAMGMARALRGHLLYRGASLRAVAKMLGLSDKGNALIKVKGMDRRAILSSGLWNEFATYALQDVNLCAGIYDQLSPEFPSAERRVMDLVLRCAVQPRFMIDTQLLQQHIQDVKDEKQAMLDACKLADRSTLMATGAFKQALEDLGVQIIYKKSPTGKDVPAFAKTDEFMTQLQEHEDPRVQALAAARLGHKSTLEETRSEKLLSIAELPWENYRQGKFVLPVPLGYGKAHTHRLAGEWGMNMQNLPSSRVKTSKLRKSLVAPDGCNVLTSDLGQIEARIDAWFCNQVDLLDQFAQKKDPYMIMGASIFGCPITGVKDADASAFPIERFIGKTAILGLGYGCGADKFFDMVVKMARVQKIALGTKWTPHMAQTSVTKYRKKYSHIAQMWRRLDKILQVAWLGVGAPVKVGPVTIGHGYVLLPNGMYLRYANPRRNVLGELVYTYGKFTHHIYGAKLLENIVQALARIVVMNSALRLDDCGYRFVLQAHDELVFIVRDNDLDNAKNIVHVEMIRRPSWAPDLPLVADVGFGQSYGEAK